MIMIDKLREVCEGLNREGVRYVIIGGCAIFIHGYERTTKDIDLLVDPSRDNILKIKKALKDILPDAAEELLPEDIETNVVVRMAGEELVVDLIPKVGDVTFADVWPTKMVEEMDGTEIPVADLDSMLKLKEGVREIDRRDYLFLKGKKEFLERKKK